MKEGYDIIEQYMAMEACQKEVRQMREDLAIQKDELEKTHQYKEHICQGFKAAG
jgi:hypothetical protein